MIRAVLILGFAAAVLARSGGAADAPASETARLLEAITGYRHGDHRAPLIEVENHLRSTAGDPDARADLAAALAGLLSREDVTPDCKRFACRQLALAGTGGEVAVLAGLLPDPEMSDMARYALERVPAPAAGAALRAGLDVLSGKELLGTIFSVGSRRDAEAVETLGRLLRHEDAPVTCASASALASIGTERAADILAGALDAAGPGLRPEVTDALLRCAHALAAGSPGRALAVFERLRDPGEPAGVRAAALLGTISLRRADAFPLLEEALAGGAPEMEAAALRCVREMPLDPAKHSEFFSRLVPSLEPRRQEWLLSALGARPDATGVPAALAALRSDSAPVRAAAARALAEIGGEPAVEPLAAAAAKADGDELKAIQQGLSRLRGPGVNGRMIALARDRGAGARTDIIRALADRHAVEAVAVLKDAAGEPDPDVRAAAARALGALGTEEILPFLLDFIVITEEKNVRRSARKALDDVLLRAESPADHAEAVCNAVERAPAEARCDLLGVLPITAGEKSLAVARSHLKSDHEETVKAAIRALSDWPDPAPAPDLIAIVRGDGPVSNLALAHRGYVRLAELEDQRSPAERLAMLREADSIAPRPEDRRAVLSALAKIPLLESLEIARSRLADPDLEAEAAGASAKVAVRIMWDHPAEARDALVAACRILPEGESRKEAEDALQRLEQYRHYLTAWSVAGPYGEEGRTAEELLDVVFPPEHPGDAAVGWTPLDRSWRPSDPWRIDLNACLKDAGWEDRTSTLASSGNLTIQTVKPLTNCVAYLRAYVWSPGGQRVRMHLGSDDGVKVWLNGESVHRNAAVRALADEQDKVRVRLRRGWNVLLLKVTQGEGQWGASVCFRRSFARKVTNLKVRATKPEVSFNE